MTHSSRPVTERFSDRVADYVAGRPGYPSTLFGKLCEVGGLPPAGGRVADIGSGTGISAAWLLGHGYQVVAVEPNVAMRAAGDSALGGQPGFLSVAGTAEATGLPDGSVQGILAAQAFHWFQPDEARQEFVRILGSADGEAGPVVLLWNDRRTEGSALQVGYEALLQRWATDYNRVNHRRIDAAALDAFFAGGRSVDFVLKNSQSVGLEEFRARLRSSSYVPSSNDPRHGPMLTELEELFRRCEQDGRVEIVYDLRVRVGWIRSEAGQPKGR